jgi:CBS domain-containing protein
VTAALEKARPVREVMRTGLVLCDADLTVRGVARAMRDHGVRSVLAIDLSAEVVGLVDEVHLMDAWRTADSTRAAEVMDPDPLVVDPSDAVEEVARMMLERGVSRALVATSAPSAESGRWSEWKERGLPLGLLTIADLLDRAGDLEPASRGVRAPMAGGVRSARPLLVLASVLAVLVVLGLLVFFAVNSHPTVRPGCAVPTQGGC